MPQPASVPSNLPRRYENLLFPAGTKTTVPPRVGQRFQQGVPFSSSKCRGRDSINRSSRCGVPAFSTLCTAYMSYCRTAHLRTTQSGIGQATPRHCPTVPRPAPRGIPRTVGQEKIEGRRAAYEEKASSLPELGQQRTRRQTALELAKSL